jgi:hypothetical protein
MHLIVAVRETSTLNSHLTTQKPDTLPIFVFHFQIGQQPDCRRSGAILQRPTSHQYSLDERTSMARFITGDLNDRVIAPGLATRFRGCAFYPSP